MGKEFAAYLQGVGFGTILSTVTTPEPSAAVATGVFLLVVGLVYDIKSRDDD